MRRERRTPGMAKGALLAEGIKVGGTAIRRGQPVGDREIALLNEAGVEMVDVIMVGIGDMLADAAVNHVSRALAGTGLRHIPARGGKGGLLAASSGLLEYNPAALGNDAIRGSMFAIEAGPPWSAVGRGSTCMTVRTEAVLMEKACLATVLAALPNAQVHPFVPITVALVSHGDSTDQALEETAGKLCGFGAKLAVRICGVRGHEMVTLAVPKTAAAGLALCGLAPSDLGHMAVAIGAAPDDGNEAGHVHIGKVGDTTYLAFDAGKTNMRDVERMALFAQAGLDPAKAPGTG